MKCRRIVWILVCLLLLCGCEEVNTPDDTTVSLQHTTATAETTVPQETTAPTEATVPSKPSIPPETQPVTIPTEPPAIPELISVTDDAPEYNTEVSWFAVTPGQDNDYFKSTYVHLPGSAALDERWAYDGRYVFVNTEENPGLRGNHYDAYILYDAWMEKLENQHFHYAWEFFGCETVLEFDYAIYGDDVILTYSPHDNKYTGNGPSQSYGKVIDTSRGRNALLIQFYLFPDENDVNNQLWYYATLDLDTGKLNYFLSQFDRSVFQGDYDLLEWLPDGDLLLSGGRSVLLYMDIHRTQIYEIDLEFDTDLYYRCSDDSGVVFATEAAYHAARDHDTSYSEWPHPYEYQFYRYSFESGTVTKILEGGLYCHTQQLPIVTYEDAEGNYHVHDLTTGQDTVLLGAKGITTFSDSFVVYRDGEKKDYLYDTVTGETVLLDLPEGYGKDSYSPSPDGRKLMTYGKGYSLLIYDCDSRTFLEIRRTNPNPLREELLFWVAEDKLLLYSRGSDNKFRDIVVFQIK